MVITTDVSVSKPLTIEGIQRDYSPFERYSTTEDTLRFKNRRNTVLRLRNRGETVLSGLVTIESTSSSTTLNGLKLDLAAGKQLLVEANNATLTHTWVTKSHAMSGVETAVLFNSVDGTLIDQSAFVEIHDGITTSSKDSTSHRRHAILFSGTVEHTTIQNSNFEEVDGRNISLVGTFGQNIVLQNNEHNRSIFGGSLDAVYYVDLNSFSSGLIQHNQINESYISAVQIETNGSQPLVENLTISGLTVTGIIQDVLIQISNSQTSAVVSGITIRNNALTKLNGTNSDHILVHNAGIDS
jgi:hypothetical protein